MDQTDLDEPIPLNEATQTVVEALLFASSVGALHSIVRAEADGPGSLLVTLARESNFIRGASRRFRLTVRPLEDEP